MTKKLLHVVMFLVGLVATASWIRSFEGIPFLGEVRSKLLYLRDHGSAVDTLFLGSSRVHFGVVPASFDAALTESGATCRSFNLGQSGFKPNDTLALADWLADHKPPALRRMFIELHAFIQSGIDQNWMNEREVLLCRPEQFSARVRAALSLTDPSISRLDVLTNITAHTLVNALCIGRGVRIVRGLTEQEKSPWPGGRLAKQGGYRPVTEGAANNPHMMRARDYWTTGDNAAQLVAKKRQALIPDDQRGGFPTQIVIDVDAHLRARGIEPVFIVMPTGGQTFFGRDGLASLPAGIFLIDLDRPDEFPALFEAADHFDSNHLLDSGADKASRQLAREYGRRTPTRPR